MADNLKDRLLEFPKLFDCTGNVNSNLYKMKSFTPLKDELIRKHGQRSISELVYREFHDINYDVLCETCFETETTFTTFKLGYLTNCSVLCANNHEATMRQKVKTRSEIGEDGLNSYERGYQKAKVTCLEKYGDEHYNNKEQRKQTCLNRYGIENPYQMDKCREISSEQGRKTSANKRLNNAAIYVTDYNGDVDVSRVSTFSESIKIKCYSMVKCRPNYSICSLDGCENGVDVKDALYCSHRCYSDSLKGVSLSDEQKKLQSDIMKRKILNGEFTPNSNNRYTHFDVKLIIDGVVYKFRSSWEAGFWILNRHLEYEKLRIPYLDEAGDEHIYISDFVDYNTRQIYEVKPSSVRYGKDSYKIDEAIKWSMDNGYDFELIDESWILSHMDKIVSELSVLNDTDDIIRKIKCVK